VILYIQKRQRGYHSTPCRFVTPSCIHAYVRAHTMCVMFVCTADEDMIMTRVRTTGIVLTDFEEKPYSFSVSSTA
jgi:hypothetical protein